METRRFIGDVHGKYKRYNKILKESPHPTIQVGDMGVGFKNQFDEPLANPPYDLMVETSARFIRGNHDNPCVCKRHTQCIDDGTMETTASGTKIMYVGGAWSIDGNQRIPGYSWWYDEELSVQDFDKVIFNYIAFAPDIMVTHDFPQSAAIELFLKANNWPLYKTRTGQAFEAMLSLHKPKTWIAGHWHINKDQNINGTRFICLGELETIDLEV